MHVLCKCEFTDLVNEVYFSWTKSTMQVDITPMFNHWITLMCLLKQCLNTVVWHRYVVTFLASLTKAQWQSDTERRIYRSAGLTAEILWQGLHPLRLYKQGVDLLTLCWTKWKRISPPPLSLSLTLPPLSLCLCPNSYWENPESHAFDICITPGGNALAQCTRQLILTMSSALGGRMKQRFDLIGYEKVPRLGPVGMEGFKGGKCSAHARTNAQSFDLSIWQLSFPVWIHQWVSRINTH